MKRLWLPLVAGGFFAMGLNADSVATGSAEVSHEIEYLEVSFTVASECYKSEKDAREANNTAVAALMSILDKSLVGARIDTNDISTSGGGAGPFERNRRVGNENVVECRNTWQQGTTVTYRSNDLGNWDQNINDIHDAVALLSTTVVVEEDAGPVVDTPVTNISWSTPSGNICQATRDEMELKAEALATKRANTIFYQRAVECGIKDFSQVFIAEIGSRVSQPQYRSFGGARYESAGSSAPSSSPVVKTKFAPITVSAEVTMSYTLPLLPFCECSAYLELCKAE